MSSSFQAGCTTMVGGNPLVALPSPFDSSSANTGNATAAIGLTNAGQYTRRAQAVTTVGGFWVTPPSFAGAAYECMFTVLSGTVNLAGSASTGSWLPLSSSYFWGRGPQGAGVGVITGTLQIRRASDLTVLASVSCTITADAT